MHITRNQERLLENGGFGERKSMEILCALGDIFGADRLVPIDSAHVSGVSYKTIGDHGIEFLSQMSKDTKVKVRTTANPIAMDRGRWGEMGIPEDFAGKQMQIVRIYESIGVEDSWTCTPYLAGNLPSFGNLIAWAESSAVVFANSTLGARTNRESGPSALASALTGLTPEYGLHLDDNRKASLVISVKADMGEKDYAALGCIVGELARDGVPYFKGIAPDKDNMKTLGAALASTGSVAMYHIEGITPEYENAIADNIETVEITHLDLKEKGEDLGTEGHPDLLAVGCPHLSREELERLAQMDKPGKDDTETWFCTSKHVFDGSSDLIPRLERLGKVICDTCMVVCPIEGKSGIVGTNSGKAATYLPKFCSQEVVFDDTDSLVRRFL